MDHQFSSKIQQNGSIPWDHAHMRIGTGFDVATRETLPSAFYSVENEDDFDQDVPSKFELQAQVFRNQKELADYLESFSKANVSYFSPASMITLASHIKTAKCNANNLCLVMRCAITTKADHYHDDLDLTVEARKLLDQDPSAFVKGYGEYCVTGHIRQSSFCAISTYSSDSTADLSNFAAGLGVTGQVKEGGLDEASTILHQAESHASSIKESHRILVDGCEGGADLTWLEEGNLIEAWQGFRAEYKPIPHVALLNHYSSILVNKISRPTKYCDVSSEAAEAIWKCAILQMTVRTSNGSRDAIVSKLDKFDKRLSALGSSHDRGDLEVIREISAKLDATRDELRRVVQPTLRSELELLSEEESLTFAEGKWSHAPYNTCGEDTWEFGLTSRNFKELGIDASATTISVKTCILPDSDRLVTQKPDPIRHNLPGHIAIGALLKNRYANPRHGGKWARLGGWLGRDTFAIKVETQHFRGCDWELTVWSVPEELYDLEL